MVHKVSNRGTEPVPVLSIGILVWNEEETIGPALQSLFRQSLFARLAQWQLQCEILCVANGCTDRTSAVASQIFQEQAGSHPFKDTFRCRTVDVPQRGKNNAWNLLVHELSAREAQTLCLMDGDIVLKDPETLWNMCAALSGNASASITTDQPLKDIALVSKPSLWQKLSLSTSRMTQGGAAQLSGQLYCIRAAVARNIYLPRDLVACEDGFIKALACTDFLLRNVCPDRVVLARNAYHIFQAYTAAGDILRNQKRQMIGQTIVHILVDRYLKGFPLEQKLHLAETIREKEQADPDWLKRLIAAHLQRVRFFWRLFPGLLTFRFQRLAKLKGSKQIIHFPAAVAGFFLGLLAGWLAWRFLKQGSTQYWPDTRSAHLRRLSAMQAASAQPIVKDAA